MGDWTKHRNGTYNCSLFQVKDDATRNSARSQLERFYYDRFHAHGQSIQFETKVRAPRVLGVHVAVAHDRHDDTEPMANGARGFLCRRAVSRADRRRVVQVPSHVHVHLPVQAGHASTKSTM
jgi:hypothetical protein